MTDLEKLKEFENWLSDVEEEKPTITRNGKISVIAASGEYYRIFTTEGFTIRNICVALNRYCPEYMIVAFTYGEFPTSVVDNSGWKKLTPEELEEISCFSQEFPEMTKRQILETAASFRDAMNYWYIQQANKKAYPSKRPFIGVPVEHIPYAAAAAYGTTIDHPLFIDDDETVYNIPSDILLHYDGHRVERTLYGEKRSGYLIERCRLENKRKKNN